jgi:hypothetical protein
MTDQNAVKIGIDELGAHQKHLAGLADRVTTARDAARTTLSPDAFGVFGGELAVDCIQSQQEGADALEIVLDATNVHHDNVGAWARDLATNELDLVAMFRVIGETDE